MWNGDLAPRLRSPLPGGRARYAPGILRRAGARVIVAPTHVLEPDVPWEYITAFVEAVRAGL